MGEWLKEVMGREGKGKEDKRSKPYQRNIWKEEYHVLTDHCNS
jgi:hypothetical protein